MATTSNYPNLSRYFNLSYIEVAIVYLSIDCLSGISSTFFKVSIYVSIALQHYSTQARTHFLFPFFPDHF